MGRHNGKSRSKAGNLAVGAALTNRHKGKKGGTAEAEAAVASSKRHTTDFGGMQSVLEATDLGEFMELASLANRDFTAEKAIDAVIVDSIALDDPGAAAASAAAAAAAAARAEPLLTLPRRPAWTPDMTPDELDASERAAFLEWRRRLAGLEADPALTLTPFEKNVEVWRQLWRVVERSHVVVQVVDGRDPLRYYSADLAALAAEGAAPHPAPRSLVLLNKADLLPAPVRAAWAAHFGERGVETVFWSAKAADEAAKAFAAAAAAEAVGAPPPPPPPPSPYASDDPVTRVLGVDDLLDYLELAAAAGRDAMAEAGAPAARVGAAPTAGFVGFPNVGKSSTLNALYGRKKAAVAPTPGRTKHFQTLDVVGRRLTLCDCPGLVLPRAAASKADMVAAGVVPIDRLTDVRSPAAVVAARVVRGELEAAYGVSLPSPLSGAVLLQTVAASRGWVVQAALPDEARAGRLVLRDYCSGRLPHWEWPPGVGEGGGSERGAASAAAAPATPTLDAAAPAGPSAPSPEVEPPSVAGLTLGDDSDGGVPIDVPADAAAAGPPKPRRAEHKFHKRAARTKGDRGYARNDGGGYDGGALVTGRKGGLVRPAAPTQTG